MQMLLNTCVVKCGKGQTLIRIGCEKVPGSEREFVTINEKTWNNIVNKLHIRKYGEKPIK